MCQDPTHKIQWNTVYISTVLFCAVVWLFRNKWKELTALIFMWQVDEAELSAATHPTMQRHIPEDQILILNPNEEHNKRYIFRSVTVKCTVPKLSRDLW